MAKATKDRTNPGYKELREAVKADQISRLYVLTGEESFLMDRFILLLSQTLIRPETAELDQVTISTVRSGNRLTVDRLRAEVMTPPFFSRRRLVIVRQSGWFAPARTGKRLAEENEDSDARDIEGSEAEAETDAPARGQAVSADQLSSLLNELPDSVCLVFCEQKVDKRLKSLMTAIQKMGVLGEFVREQPAILLQWIEGECRRRSLTIDRDAAESLIDRCENQMQVIWNELSKLFLYAEGKHINRIGLPVIAELSLPDLRGTIFDLTDAISSGRTAQALTLLDTLIAQKQPVQLITFMLARHFRQLLVAKSAGSQDQVVSRLKVMPFVAARLINQARSMTLDSLEARYSACFEADLAVKTGQLTDRLALEMLLISAAEQAGSRKRASERR